MTMQTEITDRKLYIPYTNTYSRIMEIKVLHVGNPTFFSKKICLNISSELNFKVTTTSENEMDSNFCLIV